MAQRSHSPPAVSPLRFRTQLFTITLVVLLSYVLAALPHTPHTPYAAYSTELNALDSAEAALPQYNSVRESTWQPSEDDAFDDDDDLESSVSADELELIDGFASRKYKTLKFAVLLPFNLTDRNYVFRKIAMLSATSVSVTRILIALGEGKQYLSIDHEGYQTHRPALLFTNLGTYSKAVKLAVEDINRAKILPGIS